MRIRIRNHEFNYDDLVCEEYVVDLLLVSHVEILFVQQLTTRSPLLDPSDQYSLLSTLFLIIFSAYFLPN